MEIVVTVSTGFYGATHVVRHDIEDLGLTVDEFKDMSEKEKDDLFASLKEEAIFENISASCEVIEDDGRVGH